MMSRKMASARRASVIAAISGGTTVTRHSARSRTASAASASDVPRSTTITFCHSTTTSRTRPTRSPVSVSTSSGRSVPGRTPIPVRWLTMFPRSTDSKSTCAALVALAIEPVAMRSANRAACPNGAARSMRRTWRGNLRASAAAVLMASVVVPAPPLAEKNATIGAARREALCASLAAAADSSCSHSLSSITAIFSTSAPSPSRRPSRSRVSRTAPVSP